MENAIALLQDSEELKSLEQWSDAELAVHDNIWIQHELVALGKAVAA